MIVDSDIEKVRIFCKTPTYENWASLSKNTKTALIGFSKKKSSDDKSYTKVIRDNTPGYKHIENLESNLAVLNQALVDLSDKQAAHIMETSDKIDKMVRNVETFENKNTHDDVMKAIMALRTEIDDKFYAYSTMLQSINDQTANDVSTLQVSNNGENQALVNQIRTLQAENKELANNSGLLSSMLVEKASGNDPAILEDLGKNLETLKANEDVLVEVINSGDLSKVTKNLVNKYGDSLYKLANAINKKQDDKNKAAKTAAEQAKKIQAEADRRAAIERKRVEQERLKQQKEQERERNKAEAAAQKKREEEEARVKAEAEAAAVNKKKEEEARVKAEAEAVAVKKKKEEEARVKAEAEAAAVNKKKEEEARVKAEAELKQQQEEEMNRTQGEAAEQQKVKQTRRTRLEVANANAMKANDPRELQRQAKKAKKKAELERKEAEAAAERQPGVTKLNLADRRAMTTDEAREEAKLEFMMKKAEEAEAEAVEAEVVAVEAEAEAVEAKAELATEVELAAADAILEADKAEKASASANTSILNFLKQQNEQAAIDTDERVDRLKALPVV